MIGSMQEFNYEMGVNSYMRFVLDFTDEIKLGKDYVYRITLPEERDREPISTNPDAKYACYINGTQVLDCLPTSWRSNTTSFQIDELTQYVTCEIRANGPYIEQMIRTNNASYGMMNLYRRDSTAAAGWTYWTWHFNKHLSSIEFSDGCGLKEFGNWYLFSDAAKLNKIILPATVTKVGKWFPHRANKYITIVCKAQFPPYHEDPQFIPQGWRRDEWYNNTIIYVPKGCAQYYKAQTRWEWCEIGDCPIDTEEPNAWANYKNIVELDY